MVDGDAALLGDGDVLIGARRLTGQPQDRVAVLEQPLGRDDLVRHAALQRELKTPICLDESVTDVDRAEDMIALRAGRIINIKPGRVGGFGGPPNRNFGRVFLIIRRTRAGTARPCDSAIPTSARRTSEYGLGSWSGRGVTGSLYPGHAATGPQTETVRTPAIGLEIRTRRVQYC